MTGESHDTHLLHHLRPLVYQALGKTQSVLYVETSSLLFAAGFLISRNPLAFFPHPLRKNKKREREK